MTIRFMRKTVLKIRDACRATGVATGIHTSSVKYTRRYLDLGFNFVTLGSDARFMAKAATADLAAVHGGREP